VSPEDWAARSGEPGGGADGVAEEATVWAVDDAFRGLSGSERTFSVDTIALAVGLTPMAELAWLAGCRMRYIPELGGHVPFHDGRMAASAPGVFVAGNVSGFEEASSAMEEGRRAGVPVKASRARYAPGPGAAICSSAAARRSRGPRSWRRSTRAS
jgi:thioredoxin reductase